MSETKLTQRLPKSYTFYSPPELAAILQWAGFDYAALGNNHTWDYQEQGLVPTIAALEVFEKGAVRSTLMSAVGAAARRSAELGQESG